jgi:hypothetical protein
MRLVDRADVAGMVSRPSSSTRGSGSEYEITARISARLAREELEGAAEEPGLAVRFDLVEQDEAAEIHAGERLEAGVLRHGVIIHWLREDGDADELAAALEPRRKRPARKRAAG